METKNDLKAVILGFDIGKKTDHSALVILEKWQKRANDYIKGWNDVDKPFYNLVHMDRLPLDTPHNVQIQHIVKAMDRVNEIYREKRINPYLVIDASGIGDTHFDEYKHLGFNVYGITIHGGREVSISNRTYGVSKLDLTSALAVLLENSRLNIAEDLPGRDILTKELMTFSWKQTDTGHFKFEHLKNSDHDDTVLALQVACWFGEKGIREFTVGTRLPGV